MEERTVQVGGRLDIETSADTGTTVYVDVPLVSDTPLEAVTRHE